MPDAEPEEPAGRWFIALFSTPVEAIRRQDAFFRTVVTGLGGSVTPCRPLSCRMDPLQIDDVLEVPTNQHVVEYGARRIANRGSHRYNAFMSHQSKRVIEEALNLSEEDRAEVAATLIESLDGAPDADAAAAWEVEIARRLRELSDGTVETVPWSEVRDRLRGQDPKRGG